jgi:hypothetical protein
MLPPPIIVNFSATLFVIVLLEDEEDEEEVEEALMQARLVMNGNVRHMLPAKRRAVGIVSAWVVSKQITTVVTAHYNATLQGLKVCKLYTFGTSACHYSSSEKIISSAPVLEERYATAAYRGAFS